jgi:hypothetical protein
MGVGAAIQRLFTLPEVPPHLQTYITRLNAIETIKDIDLHIEEVTGDDKTVDIVVDIFNRVNSGGTKLSKGDLALAKICAQWPEARQEMKTRLDKWWQAGFHFRLEWLLRNINTILTGEALFSALNPHIPAGLTAGRKGSRHAAELDRRTTWPRPRSSAGRPICLPLDGTISHAA